MSDPRHHDLQVLCLCAAWCGVCRDYRTTFDEASAAFATAAAFRWVDIEDEATLLDDIDVENFPTVLIVRGGHALFFGTVTPQPATLARLVQRAVEGALPPLADSPAVDAFVQRLRVAGA